jgi:hypothetical protein
MASIKLDLPEPLEPISTLRFFKGKPTPSLSKESKF